MWRLVVGYLQAESPAVPSFLVEGQRPYFLYLSQSHRIASRGQVLQIAESPLCLDCNNISGSLAGKDVTDYVPDLESGLVFPEQACQKVMDTQGPCSWHTKSEHTELPCAWLCSG